MAFEVNYSPEQEQEQEQEVFRLHAHVYHVMRGRRRRML